MGKLDDIKKNISGNELLEEGYKSIKKIGITYAYDWTLKKKFKDACGRDLNLENPQTFSEKIQWLKENDRNPYYVQCADKVLVRDIISKKIGEKYLTQVYGIYNDANEIDFDLLPESFVLKTNHASGQVIVVPDKSKINVQSVKNQLNKWIHENYYYVTGEWIYKDIQPKIICEELLDEKIVDYKFYCFNGMPKFLYITTHYTGELELNFLNLDWTKTEFQYDMFKQFKSIPPKPNNFDEMLEIAKSLSQEFTFVRVDLFSVMGKIYFSELTFYPTGGFAPFKPDKWEDIIGNWLKLPIKNGEE